MRDPVSKNQGGHHLRNVSPDLHKYAGLKGTYMHGVCVGDGDRKGKFGGRKEGNTVTSEASSA